MYTNLTSHITTIPPQQRVLLRADLNVPLHNGTIIDDFRLTKIIPTLTALQQRNAKIVLATHLGQPSGIDPHLSTKKLIPWLEEHGYTVEHATTLDDAYTKSLLDNNALVLLENIRFFDGEKSNDALFAQQVARLGDYYVNDAFGMMHRNDTSVTRVPELFAKDKRTIGLLVEQELQALDTLIHAHKKPYVAIVGGKKAATKLPLIKELIHHVDTILLCPALAFTFLKAQEKNVGTSLVDDTQTATCLEIMERARARNVTLQLPLDYQVAHMTPDGDLSYTQDDTIAHDEYGIAIGPKTTELFCSSIIQAGTVFFNGAMGFTQRKETLRATHALFNAMQMSSAYTLIAGGDSIAMARILDATDSIDYLSTGGGATLAYLSGQNLPGMQAFL